MTDISTCKRWEMRVVGYKVIPPSAQKTEYGSLPYIDPLWGQHRTITTADQMRYRSFNSAAVVQEKPQPFKGVRLTDPVPLVVTAAILCGIVVIRAVLK